MRTSAVRVAVFRPKGFLGRQPGAKPVGCVGYVSTGAGFGKARGDVFFDFMTGENGPIGTKKPSTCHKFHKGPACGNKIIGETPLLGKRHGYAPDERPLAGAG